MRDARARTAAGVCAAAGILAGVLGSLLAGQWLWGVAAGVLALTVVATGAEVIRAGAEGSERRQADSETATAGQRTEISGVAGVTATNSTVAGRDVGQSMHVTNVSKRQQGNPVPRVASMGVAAVLVLVAGTGLLSCASGGASQQPGPSVSTSLAPPSSPQASASAQSSSLPSVSYHLAATYQESNSGGDSITQQVSFGAPLTGTQVAALTSDSQGACDNLYDPNVQSSAAPVPLSRELVIPFQIVSTVGSSQQVTASVFLSADDFDTNGSDSGLVAATGSPIAVGESDGQWLCWDAVWDGAESGTGNGTVVVNPGTPTTFDGWLVFNGGISPDYPSGNPAQIGDTFATLQISEVGGTTVDSMKVTGPGVCGGDVFNDLDNPPYLHLGGPVSSTEDCTGSYSGSPS